MLNRFILTATLVLFAAVASFAQTPQDLNYPTIVRGANGPVLVNYTGGALASSTYAGVGGVSHTSIGVNVSMEIVSDGTDWYETR